MSREIKFRGKRIDTGEWIYGDYFKYQLDIPQKQGYKRTLFYAINYMNEAVKIYNNASVDPKTVGQFTERKDKNEVEVYAEDIVKVQQGYYPQIIGRVTFEDGQWMVTKSDGEKWNLYSVTIFMKSIEVIGNMFDNPELLEANPCS